MSASSRRRPTAPVARYPPVLAGRLPRGEPGDDFELVGGRVVLVVIFDNRTSLGLVRLRIKKATEELEKIFASLAARQAASPGAGSPFAEISDADIDNLFSE